MEEEKEEAMSEGTDSFEKNEYEDKDISELFENLEKRTPDKSFDIY